MVEDLHKKREPLVTMEAIYLMTPSEESIRILMRDFEHPNRPMYKAAHVYFSEGTNINPTQINFLQYFSVSWNVQFFFLCFQFHMMIII